MIYTVYTHFYVRTRLCQKGAVIVEFAVLLPLLVLLLVGASDVGLAILARHQLEGAARAGAEFAILNGYAEDGIKKAILLAASSSNDTINRTIIPLSASNIVTPLRMRCVCPVDDPTNGPSLVEYYDRAVSPAIPCSSFSETPTSALITPLGQCPATSSLGITPVLNFEINISANYRPFLPYLWPTAVNGLVPISVKYSFRTFVE